MAAMHTLKVWERWRNFDSNGKWSLNSHVRALQLTEEDFDVLSMPFDIISAKKVQPLPVEFVIQDRDEAARHVANLDTDMVNFFTDGSHMFGALRQWTRCLQGQ